MADTMMRSSWEVIAGCPFVVKKYAVGGKVLKCSDRGGPPSGWAVDGPRDG
jgi:hypothetical protein